MTLVLLSMKLKAQRSKTTFGPFCFYCYAKKSKIYFSEYICLLVFDSRNKVLLKLVYILGGWSFSLNIIFGKQVIYFKFCSITFWRKKVILLNFIKTLFQRSTWLKVFWVQVKLEYKICGLWVITRGQMFTSSLSLSNRTGNAFIAMHLE